MGNVLGVCFPFCDCCSRLSTLLTICSQGITGWVGLIRVDGVAYTWMGAPLNWPQVVDQTDFSYTSTRSTFVMNVGGKVGMNITFLSPVTPNDLRRQSLQFSYLDVAVQSIDGAGHDVEIYADVSGGM